MNSRRAAKPESCDAGTKISLSFEDLQEMQNDFVERLERGLTKMADERLNEKK